jgi:hypothetical protein
VLTGWAIGRELGPYGDLSAFLQDALFRVFMQNDLKVYGLGALVVWRHFMCSGFAVSLSFLNSIKLVIRYVYICSDHT